MAKHSGIKIKTEVSSVPKKKGIEVHSFKEELDKLSVIKDKYNAIPQKISELVSHAKQDVERFNLENIKNAVQDEETLKVILREIEILQEINHYYEVSLNQLTGQIKSESFSSGTKSDLNILVVDDSSVMRRMVINTLSRIGFKNFIEAPNGLEALNKLKNNRVDMILTDWNMPEMNGIAFVKAIHSTKTYKNLPIIMITTESGQKAVIEAFKYGVSEYIIKPFSPEKLHIKVESALKKTKTG